MIQKYWKNYLNMPVQVRASLWFLICSFLQRGISVITTPIFTRLLNTAEYGQYNVFNSWLGILSILVSLQICAGVYNQGLVKFEEDRKVFSSSLQGLSLILSVFWTVIYLVFHDFWNNLFHLNTAQMLAMLLMIWTTSVFGFWAAEQRVTYQYKWLVVITLLSSVAKPVLGIVLVTHADDKVTARILGLAIVEVAGYTWMFVRQMQRGRKFFSGKYWIYALGFNLLLVPHYLSQTVLNNSDRIMITEMVSDSAAGIYSLAYSVSLIMTLFNTALMNTISPWIYQKIKNKKTNEIAKVAYSSLVLIAGVNILLIAFAPEAVAVFAPPSYYDAIWVIPPVAMSVFFMYCYDLFAKFEFYFEKTHYIMAASIGGAVLNLILNYFFIKRFGYYAAGYTTLFCYIVYAALHYFFMKKVCRRYLDGARVYSGRILISMAGIFMGLGFLYLFTYKSMLYRYLLTAILFIVIFVKRKFIISHIKQYF